MEENNNGELTFKVIWEKLKKSGVRILVYCLIAAIVVGGILGICDIFVSQSQYETSVTYYYSGVEEGKDPWGGSNDIVNEIKSASNVSKALQTLEYSDEEIDALVGLIIRNISVISSTNNEVTAEDGTTLSANYSFRIVLTQDSEIDKHLKSRNDYNNIINAITNEHINSFKTKYSIGTSLTKLESVESYNYFRKYTTVETYTKIMQEEIKIWQAMAPDFISASQNINFAALNARIDGVRFKADSYLNFILFNGINANNESEYIDMQLKAAEDLIAVYDEEIKKQNEVLNALMQNQSSSIGTGGTVIINPPDEKVLKPVVDAVALAIENKVAAGVAKDNWTSYKNYFNASNYNSLSDEQKQELKNQAAVLENQILSEVNAVIDSYMTMISEYNDGYNVSSLVRMSSIPTQTTNSPITFKIGIIVELITIIAAAIVALIVTGKKGKMNLKRKKTFSQPQVVLIENNQGFKASEPQNGMQPQNDMQSQNNAQPAKQEAIAPTQEIEGTVENQEDETSFNK